MQDYKKETIPKHYVFHSKSGTKVFTDSQQTGFLNDQLSVLKTLDEYNESELISDVYSRESLRSILNSIFFKFNKLTLKLLQFVVQIFTQIFETKILTAKIHHFQCFAIQ